MSFMTDPLSVKLSKLFPFHLGDKVFKINDVTEMDTKTGLCLHLYIIQNKTHFQSYNLRRNIRQPCLFSTILYRRPETLSK